ncbi:MAG: hypothetical protein E5V54_22680 [Mesorhizobium sp.]|nr:MAG: hypothetical protein E5V54_22680 [Mesorhizobium sp.]
MSKFFVVTSHGQRYESPNLEVMKTMLEYTVNAVTQLGFPLAITDWSPELEDFLMKLQQQYPRQIIDLSSSNDKI